MARGHTLTLVHTMYVVMNAAVSLPDRIIGEWRNIWHSVSRYTVFDPIGARGAYVNLFSTSSAKRSSSGR